MITNFKINHQNGYAVLATSLFILLAASLAALYSTMSAVAEERVSSNDYKVRLAFEAADAGVEFGLAYLKEHRNAILVDANSDGYLDNYSSSDITNVGLPNAASYTITYSNPVANDFNLIQINSTGKFDTNVTRTVTQLLSFRPFLKALPPGSIVAKDKVDISGSLNVSNASTGTTIWSGSDVTLGGSASTTGINGISSDKNGINSDVISKDNNLANMSYDQFFLSFFGVPQADAEQYADVVYTNTGNTNYSPILDNVTGKTIWINQSGGDVTINSNTTIGSASDPVILVINGNLSLNGSATVYGLVYITNSSHTWINNGGGTFNVIGSLVVNGSAQSSGTPNVNFQPPTLNNTKKLGDYVKVPGTWRDF